MARGPKKRKSARLEICDCRGTTKNRRRRLMQGSATVIGAGESATQRAARRAHRRRLDPRPVRASRADRVSTRARIPAFACPAIRPRIRVERASRGSVDSRDAPEANLRRRRRRARWTRCDGPPSQWRGAAATNPRSVAIPRWTSRWCVIARSVGSALAPHVASQSRFSTSPLTRDPDPQPLEAQTSGSDEFSFDDIAFVDFECVDDHAAEPWCVLDRDAPFTRARAPRRVRRFVSLRERQPTIIFDG